jgi:hypothetical protein
MPEYVNKENILKTARLLADESPIESTDLAAYLEISNQSAAGLLRWNYASIGLECEKIQSDPSQIPRRLYSVKGKTDESYLLKKSQKISEIKKNLCLEPQKKKKAVVRNSNIEPQKRNGNKIPYYIMEMAKQSENRRKK